MRRTVAMTARALSGPALLALALLVGGGGVAAQEATGESPLVECLMANADADLEEATERVMLLAETQAPREERVDAIQQLGLMTIDIATAHCGATADFLASGAAYPDLLRFGALMSERVTARRQEGADQ